MTAVDFYHTDIQGSTQLKNNKKSMFAYRLINQLFATRIKKNPKICTATDMSLAHVHRSKKKHREN